MLAVTGGMNSVSSFEVLKVTGEDQDGLERAGSTLLSMDQTSLHNGRCIANVPCMPGIPTGVTLHGGDSAYVATMGIGVQGVSVTEDAVARHKADWPSNLREPALHTGSGTPMAAETMGNVILAGNIRKLWLLSSDLRSAEPVDIPARDMCGITGYPADASGGGEDKPIDLIFVAGQDRRFHVVEAAKKAVISEVGIGEHLRSVRVSTHDRLAYVSTFEGNVHVIDIDDLFEGTELIDKDGDGRDDRILGRVSGLSGAGPFDIAGDFGYVGDPANGTVHVIRLHRIVLDMTATEIDDPEDDEEALLRKVLYETVPEGKEDEPGAYVYIYSATIPFGYVTLLGERGRATPTY